MGSAVPAWTAPRSATPRCWPSAGSAKGVGRVREPPLPRPGRPGRTSRRPPATPSPPRWSGPATWRPGPDGSVLVDISSFLTRDAIGIADPEAGRPGALQAGRRPHPGRPGGGRRPSPRTWSSRPARPSPSTSPGGPRPATSRRMPRMPPSPSTTASSSCRKPGFVAAPFDPRSGAFDPSSPTTPRRWTRTMVQRLANRFRLEKTDPTAAALDASRSRSSSTSTAPRPSRSAPPCWRARPGGPRPSSAAGYIDAYRVELLPEGADPLDVRYNVINWVNRATRGWSYGQSVADPRTGEIVKGSVLLGSLRVRQDMLIFEGLVGADHDRRRAGPTIRQRRARPHPPAGGARGRPRHRPAAQFRGQHPGSRLGDGLSGAADRDHGRRPARLQRRLWRRHGRLGPFAIDQVYGDAGAYRCARPRSRPAWRGCGSCPTPTARVGGDAQPWGSLWDNGSDPVEELDHIHEDPPHRPRPFRPAQPAQGSAVNDLRRRLVPIYLFTAIRWMRSPSSWAGSTTAIRSWATDAKRRRRFPRRPSAPRWRPWRDPEPGRTGPARAVARPAGGAAVGRGRSPERHRGVQGAGGPRLRSGRGRRCRRRRDAGRPVRARSGSIA